MTKHRIQTAAMAGIIAAALALPALADAEGFGVLQPKQEGNVTYITGGIGDSEVDQLKAQSGNYNFQMINSDPTGHYTADTNLVIQSKDGREVIRVDNAGPLFYAQLP